MSVIAGIILTILLIAFTAKVISDMSSSNNKEEDK